jgi:hypothetical protein
LKPPEGLTAGARAAWRQAVAVMGGDEVASFRTAVIAYVRAVDLADRARDEWYAAKRPIVFRQPNGALGVHPLVSAIVATSRSVMSHAGELGLTPMSAARLGRLGARRGPGRPVGANSAPDRVALPGIQYRREPAVLALAPRPGIVTRDVLPAPLGRDDAAAVNRSRGHRED